MRTPRLSRRGLSLAGVAVAFVLAGCADDATNASPPAAPAAPASVAAVAPPVVVSEYAPLFRTDVRPVDTSSYGIVGLWGSGDVRIAIYDRADPPAAGLNKPPASMLAVALKCGDAGIVGVTVRARTSFETFEVLDAKSASIGDCKLTIGPRALRRCDRADMAPCYAFDNPVRSWSMRVDSHLFEVAGAERPLQFAKLSDEVPGL